jgi:hypothetical protein
MTVHKRCKNIHERVNGQKKYNTFSHGSFSLSEHT